MATRTITGNVKDLTDSAVASGVVTFEKLVTSTTGTTIHQSGVDTATTDGSGDFSIDLAAPATGSYRYRMILPNGWSFYFSIASGASVNVATLIAAETITDQDAIVEALEAYLPLAGGTMTGALTLSGAPTVDLHAATKKYVDDNAGGGASDVDDLTTNTGQAGQYMRVDSLDADGLEYRDPSQVLSDIGAETAGAAATVQGNLNTHTSNTSNPHSVTAAQAGALATANNLSELTATASTARTNIVAAASGANSDITRLTGLTTPYITPSDITSNAFTFQRASFPFGLATGAEFHTGGTRVGVSDTYGPYTILGQNNRVYWLSWSTSAPTGTIWIGGKSANAAGASVNNTSITQILNVAQLLSSALIRDDNSTDTNAIRTIATIGHNSTGTPDIGFGAAMAFTLKSSTTANTAAGRVVTLWNIATHASRVPDMVAYLTDSADEREIWRGRANGSAAAIGFLGATPVARQAHIADASGDDAATVNAILDVLEAFGLVATS